MIRLSWVLFLVLSINCSIAEAQSENVKCGVEMVNYAWPDTRVISNENASYIARLEPPTKMAESMVGPKAYIYALDKKNNYQLVSSFSLFQEIMPIYSYLSSGGSLVVFGEMNTREFKDDIYIFSRSGKLDKRITGKDVFSRAELKKSIELNDKSMRCQIENPWIFWDIRPVFEDDELILVDTLGQTVRIDSNSGKIEKTN